MSTFSKCHRALQHSTMNSEKRIAQETNKADCVKIFFLLVGCSTVLQYDVESCIKQ
jgi:hypothetical protein